MPNFTISEIITIVLVILIVFGPHRLPELARKAGELVSKGRALANDLRGEFEDEIRDVTEPLKEVSDELKGARRDMQSSMKSITDDVQRAKKDVETELAEAKKDVEAELAEVKKEAEAVTSVPADESKPGKAEADDVEDEGGSGDVAGLEPDGSDTEGRS